MDSLLTVIEFIFVSSTNEIKPNEFSFQFFLDGEEFKLNEKNQITFIPKCPRSKIYYGETITVLYNNKILCSFHFLIYINKKNNIIFDLDEIDKCSFELFFYAKESQYNPTVIKYKGIEYNQFMNYGNKLRSRIFFANVNSYQLEYINSPTLNKYKYKNNTYQAIFRLFEKEKYEVTLTDMMCYVYNYNDLKYDKLTKAQFEELQEMVSNFAEKYLELIYGEEISDNELQKIQKELNDLSKIIIENELYYFINKPSQNDYISYEDSKDISFNQNSILYLFYLDLFLNEFLELKETGKLSNKEKFKQIQNLIKNNHELEEELYKKLINDKFLDIEQKINVLKTITIFFKNSLRKENLIAGLNYVNMKTISKNSPYFKSRELLKKIIFELTEDSRLFEALIYVNSEVIENILVENKERKYSYQNLFGKKENIDLLIYITEYGINLMTVDEIKAHLLELLPTVIIQIDTNINMRSLFESETKMMVINEYIMFNNLCKINEKTIFKQEPDYYIIPIAIEILNEIMGHAKIRYKSNNEGDNYSPLVVRDRNNNFKPQKIMRRIKLFDDNEIKINKGENGRVLEHYISEDNEVIQNIKRRRLNKKLINTKYWTGKNFDLLNRVFNSENKVKNTEEILWDYLDDDQYYDCIFH